MSIKIPAPLIALLARELPSIETHNSIDLLFDSADAPELDIRAEFNKSEKVSARLKEINRCSKEPLSILGRIIEGYVEVDDEYELKNCFSPEKTLSSRSKFKHQILKKLQDYNLKYHVGGMVSSGHSIASKSLESLIKEFNFPAIEQEFYRAVTKANTEPREAVSAACNILESIFKIFIHEENLPTPQKQDLQGLWKVVRKELGFDPSKLQDDDLKKILSGAFSVVDGIGAFRTHASSAHGEGKKTYNITPRHAKLAINSAHTIAQFILETWNEKRNR
ncbi:abortive infection family protein [Photobacterium aphoticum]|uniref:ATP-dependent RNA helicase HrpA n=2 Tax=Photobacterium aphoticum TaxID=754436 RepID=A0A0J1GQR8_9GAMM|nr:abortive infection family protein [Photobacterium aphoticum]KLV02001.1 ATP-dependent RNA helicase HrpA [Photobacterium aphoticum]PSU60247.1 ATP-dependent RNA helicase HrpA [Photobacterium aphoticum]GHA34344.1 hypothetical protein GCM10007086_04770 [Photobacterium aphoticum]